VVEVIPGIGEAGIGTIDASINESFFVGTFDMEIQPETLRMSPLQGPIQHEMSAPQPSGEGLCPPGHHCHP